MLRLHIFIYIGTCVLAFKYTYVLCIDMYKQKYDFVNFTLFPTTSIYAQLLATCCIYMHMCVAQ